MKKTLAGTLLAGAMAMTIVLGGCGAQQKAAPAPQEPAAQEQTAQSTAQEQTTETTVQEETKTDDSAATMEQTTTSTPATTAQPTSQIGEEEAKRIALEDAGVAEQDAMYLSVELDTDDGVTKYEVGFNVGQTEYDYDIDAVTGTILERSAEIDD